MSEVVSILENVIDKEVLERVRELYEKLYKKYPKYSMKKNYVLACLIYIAERELGMPQDWQKISSILQIRKKEALARCSNILAALEISGLKPLAAKDYALYGLKKLGIENEQIKNEVLSLLNEFDSLNPAGYAAAAIYKVLRDHEIYRKQDEIASILGTTSATLRSHLKKIRHQNSQDVILLYS